MQVLGAFEGKEEWTVRKGRTVSQDLSKLAMCVVEGGENTHAISRVETLRPNLTKKIFVFGRHPISEK